MDPRIPRPVLLFGVVVLLAELVVVHGAVFDAADYSPDAAANARTQLMWAGRVTAMLFVVATGVLLRSAPILAVALGMRAIAETFDAVAFLRAGSGVGYVVVVVVALELTAMVWLVRSIRATAGPSSANHFA